MGRFPIRSLIIVFTAVVGLLSTSLFRHLSVQGAPQAPQGPGETAPGPIIEDPPGPYRGNFYVPVQPRGPSASAATFIVTYNGFTPQAQVAFQAAVDVWASQISSPVPIRITANWTPLGPGVLGSAGPVNIIRDFPGSVPGTWYAAALANKIAGTDLIPGSDDIQANFSSVFTWYYGTDGMAGANYDLMTVVLHEIGHGLGFFGSMTVSGGTGAWGFGSPFPAIYDLFAVNGSSQSLINTLLFPNPSAVLGTQLTSNNVFFNGPNATGALGGSLVRLYAPATWQQGSSFSHLNESTFPAGDPNSLMTPQLGAGEAIHDPGAVVRGSFADMGWGGAAPPSTTRFVPVAPCRVMDTRNPAGPLGGPLLFGGVPRTIPVPSSSCGIPANASAYSLNVTVVPSGGTLGFLTVWPTGQAQPNVSTLNSPDGVILANAAIVPSGSGGSIDAIATNNTDLIIDINGYFVPPTAGALQFYPLAPCRVLDTRNPPGTFGGPAIAGGSTRSFPITSSSCGVPSAAAAYSFNATVVPSGPLGFLTAWPTGQAQPLVSTLNSPDGTFLANAAIVPAGTGGAVSFFASNTTHLIVDINGFFASPGSFGLDFHTVTPCRVADTRNVAGPLGGPIMFAGTSRTFPVPTSPCGSFPTAAAYSMNVTVVPAGPLTFLTTWPTGLPQPTVSTLNAPKGLAKANAAIVPSGTGQNIDVFVSDTSHVILDVNGYFGP